jgi:hypothetical protein
MDTVKPEGVAATREALTAGIGPNTPLRLDVAAHLAFPDGSMTASGLRGERDRGRLVVERIANKDYTTLEEIRLMRERCRVRVKDQDSGSSQKNATPTASSSGAPRGSSPNAGKKGAAGDPPEMQS